MLKNKEPPIINGNSDCSSNYCVSGVSGNNAFGISAIIQLRIAQQWLSIIHLKQPQEQVLIILAALLHQVIWRWLLVQLKKLTQQEHLTGITLMSNMHRSHSQFNKKRRYGADAVQ